MIRRCNSIIPFITLLSLVGQSANAAKVDKANAAKMGKEVLQRALDTYQTLNTYHSRSSLDNHLISSSKPIQQLGSQVDFSFMKPNKIRMELMQPSGTTLIVCDGTHLYRYENGSRKYTVDPVGMTMETVLPKLAKRAGVVGSFDPLGFLTMKQLPPTLRKVKFIKHGTYNGKAATYLKGFTKSPAQYMTQAGNKRIAVPAMERRWRWWIEDGTNMILSMETDTPPFSVKVQAKKGKKTYYKEVRMKTALKMHIYDAKGNPPLEGSLFVFTPPAGSAELKITNAPPNK